MHKNDYRSLFKARRAALPADVFQERSRRLCRQFVTLAAKEWQGLRAILGYHPIAGEPDLLPLYAALRGRGIRIFLPVAGTAGEMRFHLWEEGRALRIGRHKIPEPEAAAPLFDAALDQPALMLVPALAVDARGYRLGYGAGYYDRYLAAHPQIYTCGLVFSDFISKAELPSESHDIRLHWIVTEDGVFRCQRT